jgi:hypothetical protein
MDEQEFLNIQSALRTATHEPESVPPSLVTRTVRRCEAVLAGRAAEAQLRQGAEIPSEKVYELAAAGVLGRLALGRRLPDGRSVPEMTQRLAGSSWLRQRMNGTAEDALRCLRGGAILRGGAENAGGEQAPWRDGPADQRTPKAKGGLGK